jgi:hypothetical protein
LSLTLRDGQTLESTFAIDPLSGKVFNVEVTLSVLHKLLRLCYALFSSLQPPAVVFLAWSWLQDERFSLGPKGKVCVR